jgi:dihydroneopterin aldolase/2-amino-4-hydroxy-6-hydroxymethyldihydropteridine diphosphokinase
MDMIEIQNLRLRAILGFSAHELDTPQDIVISLRIGLAGRLAGETDDPADAFNYKTVTKAIIRFVESSRFSLVEKLAEEIARLVVINFGAPQVEVAVQKPGALRRSDSVSLRLIRRPDDYTRNKVYLSIGSNIKPAENVSAALALLHRYTSMLAMSPVYQTAPQGYDAQEPFLNLAVRLHTLRSPEQFKVEVVDRIEAELKRVRDPANKNAPRTIDLDVSLWNDEVIEFGDKPWVIPDSDIVRFAHVAIPLADLAPEYVHPVVGKPLHVIAASFDAGHIKRVQLDLGSRSY